MPRELYNEGRVLGYSVYEEYVKHALSENPNEEPATEREWLASQLNHGLSLLLKVKADTTKTGPHYIDIPFPENSKVSSAGSIVGSLFFGSGECDDLGWVKKVTDYGQGISNVFESHPYNEVASDYPTQDIEQFDEDQKKQILQYVKIQDGLVLQPGAWVDTESGSPQCDIVPNLNKKPTLRLVFCSTITSNFYILLTGFTHRSIISGISDIDTGSTSEVKYENGAILGPEVYPWGNKVLFTYPGIAAYYLRQGMVSTYDNLKIDNSEDSWQTVFTASYLRPGSGISIYGPNTPGGDIKIGAKIEPDPNKYIKVVQKSSIENDEVVTQLTHSKLLQGTGVFVQQPTKAAENLYISSKVSSTNNFLKVVHKTPSTKDDVAVELTPSKITAGTTSGIKVTQPTSPGGNVVLNVDISSTNSNFLKVTKQDGKIILTPLEIEGDGNVEAKIVDGKLKLSINVKNLTKLILSNANSAILKLLKQLLDKIGNGGHTINPDTGQINWNLNLHSDGSYDYSNARIPLGTMNIWGGSTECIICHYDTRAGDYWVQ